MIWADRLTMLCGLVLGFVLGFMNVLAYSQNAQIGSHLEILGLGDFLEIGAVLLLPLWGFLRAVDAIFGGPKRRALRRQAYIEIFSPSQVIRHY